MNWPWSSELVSSIGEKSDVSLFYFYLFSFDYAIKDLALVSSSNFVLFSFTPCTVTAVIDKIIKERKSIIDSVCAMVELAFWDAQHQTCDSRERDNQCVQKYGERIKTGRVITFYLAAIIVLKFVSRKTHNLK